MRSATFMAVIIYLLIMALPLQAQHADTVKIVSVQVDADPVNPVTFGVPVNLVVTGDPGNMNDYISAATLGHYFDPGDYVTIDSVRLTGGLAANPLYFGCFHNDALNLGVIGFILYFNDYIAPGESGLLGTMWFTLEAGAPDHTIDIDSGFFPDVGDYVLTNGNGYDVFPAFVPGTITVGTGISSELVVEPASLTFSATEGGTDPAPQSFDISNAQSGDMDWTATETADWFGLSATAGTVPPTATVDVSVNISGLTAGTYVETILVEAPGATNSPQEVTVTLNLTEPPVLSVTPPALMFEGEEGGVNDVILNIYIDNTGGGELVWTASYDAPWLSVSPTSGTGTDVLDVGVDLTDLTADTYVELIEISAVGAVNSPQYVEVTLVVTVPPMIVLDQTVFNFSMTSLDPPQIDELNITNGGDGELSWSASNLHSWLFLSPPSGTAPSTVTLTVNPAGLDPGMYYDTITVVAAGASNSPQIVEVVLEITVPPMIVMDHTNFNFLMTDVDPPTTDELGITNGGGGELSWSASNLYSWLSLSPESGTAPSTVTLTVNAGGLDMGTYYDTITVAAAGASNSPQIVEIALEIQQYFLCGDANGDGIINVSDAVYIINHIFVGGDPPDPIEAGDPNCDGVCNVSDAVSLINNIFVGGFEPCDPTNDGIPDCGPGAIGGSLR